MKLIMFQVSNVEIRQKDKQECVSCSVTDPYIPSPIIIMPEISQSFIHRHAAHCESGAISALLRNRGLDLSEPMVFGIGNGLFFLYMPFVKIGGIPLTAYRAAPKAIIKNICKRLRITLHTERFRNPEQGMAELDHLLENGIAVGLQTGVFWLPYFPRDMRFQFNAHNLVVFGKKDDNYLISDPVFEHPVTCSYDDLQRARFAKGIFAPKGLLYYPKNIPVLPDLKKVIRKAIRQTCNRMLNIPLPFVGVRGIRCMANAIERWPIKLGLEQAPVYVGSVVRMQEEIGTGGAGFRFMYTAFLQESADLLGLSALKDAAKMMSETGDRWREFAVKGAQLCKGRETSKDIYKELAEIVRDCATCEEKIFRLLKQVV